MAIVVLVQLVFGANLALAGRPIGIDVSDDQSSGINWSTLKTTYGITFAWAKAMEGTCTSCGGNNWPTYVANAKAAGVIIGPYLYARFDEDTGTNGAVTEANAFWNAVKGNIAADGLSLMPMLDVEESESGQVNNLATNTPANLSLWIDTWCTQFSNNAYAAGLIIKPCIYSSSSFSANWFTSRLTKWNNDIAQYSYTDSGCSSCPGLNYTNGQNNAPQSSTPWSTWNFWQYDDENHGEAITTGDGDVFNGSMATLTNTMVVLSIGGAPPANVTNYWDPGNVFASPGSGGTGSWDFSTSNWWHSGSSNILWSPEGDYAVFAGTAGTVTLNAGISADAITFSNGGYTITGTSQTLSLNSPGNIVLPAATTNTIACILGGVAYTLSGGGTLVLNNANNFSLGETIIGPNTTLQIPSDHPVGNDGVTLNLQSGGIYQDLDSTSGDQFLLPGSAVALLSGGGIFENPNGNLTMSNFITGSGSLTLIGTTFTLTLTDTGNNYTGGTIVQSGQLTASAAGVLGSTSGALTVNGGTLDLGGASHTVGAMSITGGKIQDGTLTGSSYSGQAGTVSAILAGSAGMTKTGTGTTTLSATNTYTGVNTITAGLLQISSDGNLGAAPGSAVTNSITLNNGGVTAGLRCTASFTLNANRGIYLVGPNGGSIHATTGQTLTYAGKITGSGGLAIGAGYTTGYGVTLLSGANTYSGGTSIAAGTLRLGASGTLPSGTTMTIGADNNTGGGGVLDMNGFAQTIGTLSSSTGIGGTGTNTPTIKLTGSLTVLQAGNGTFAGVISGSGGNLTINGAGTLTLNSNNTYTGSTIISAGTLALGGTGSINNSSNISLAAGATLDVSAYSSYTLSSSTSLNASGTASPATIKGGTNVSLGSRPITLTYDGSHPALTISQGTLSLNGNAITVNGSVLSPGTYTLMQQSSGNVSASGSFTVAGTAIGAGMTASIAISGGNVNLIIQSTALIGSLTASQSVTYGTPGVTLGGKVSGAGPTYPTNGETVTVTINSNAQNTTINDSTGDFSLNYNLSGIPASATPYIITYSYAGDTALTAATKTNKTITINPLPVVLTGTRPYDGTATAAASILSVSNKIGSDAVTVASGSASLSSSNVGPQTIVSVGTLALGGAQAGDYTLAGATGTVTITSSNVPPFSITSSSVDATGSNFIITWQSVPGATYHVLGSSNLFTSLSNWTVIAGPITATGTNTSSTNPIVPPMQFFDVENP